MYVTLNLRKVTPELKLRLKREALSAGIGLYEYCVMKLEVDPALYSHTPMMQARSAGSGANEKAQKNAVTDTPADGATVDGVDSQLGSQPVAWATREVGKTPEAQSMANHNRPAEEVKRRIRARAAQAFPSSLRRK